MKTNLTRIERTSRLVLAILVGVLIWGAAIDQEVFSVKTFIPLSPDVPDNFIVIEEYTDSIQVDFTGSGLDMLVFQTKTPLPAVSKNLPLESIQSFPGTVTLQIGTSDVLHEGSVHVTQILPGQIPFVIDTVISRDLPVSVVLENGIPSRFLFAYTEPEYITVTGPASIVLVMDSVLTETTGISSGHCTASLALGTDMVAYSDEFVQVRLCEPAATVTGSGR